MGLVLFLLNVLWSLALGFDMFWNLFGDSVKARVCGMVAGETDGADDGAEERGVEMSQEARDLLAQRDATIAQLTTVNAQRERENAQLRREKVQYQDKIAAQDCWERTRVVTRTVTQRLTNRV